MSVCANAEAAVPEEPSQTEQLETALDKGSKAPFSGVLVPEDAYRFYQADSFLLTSCREKLRAEVSHCASTPEGWFTGRQYAFLAVGILAGVVAAGQAGR